MIKILKGGEKMNRLNLCIDIDGTITEPFYWLSRANQHFKTDVKPNDVTSYDIPKILGVDCEDYNKFYDSFGEQLHRESDIRNGAPETINKLYDMYHNIHFVTAREEKMKNVSVEWLNKFNFPMDSITLLGQPNKVEKATELKSDFFIEDSYDNAVQLANAGFEVLLIDCNYNKGIVPKNVTRVKNWYQISRIIENRALQKTKLAIAQ